jgi:valyl-tRNA synthetase
MGGAPCFEYMPVEVKVNMGLIGPHFRKDANDVVRALKNEDLATIEAQQASGEITIVVKGQQIKIESEAVVITKEVISEGREVDILEVNDAIVVIVR